MHETNALPEALEAFQALESDTAKTKKKEKRRLPWLAAIILAIPASLLIAGLVLGSMWNARVALLAELDALARDIYGQGSAVRMERPQWLSGMVAPPWLDEPAKVVAEARTERPKLLLEAQVVRGDTLINMCRRIYGSSEQLLLEQVLAANPQIQDPTALRIGDMVRFPAL
jgi:general secretion pathway protein A